MSVASSGGQTGRVTLAELGRLTIDWDDTDPWQQDFSILVVPTGHRADDLDGSFARALADRLGPQGWAAFKDAARAAAANSPHYGPDAPILFRTPKAARLGRMHRYYVLLTVFSSPRQPVSMKQVIAGLIYLMGDEKPLALPMVLMPVPGAGDGGLQLEEPIAQCLAQLHRMRAILRKTPRAEFVFTSRQELNIPRLRGISDGLESLAEIYSPWPECDKVVRWAIRLAERLVYRTTLGVDLVVSASDLLAALIYASNSKECSAYFKQPYKNILARFAKGWITATVVDYLSKPVIESGDVVLGSLRPWMMHAMEHAKESGRKLITVVDLILTMDPAIEVKGVDLETLRRDVARAWEAENQPLDLTDIQVQGEEVTFDPEVMATLEEMAQSSSTPEPPPPGSTLRITSFSSDDTDGPDLLGVDRDAKAFANLICLRAARPPLSIGLFGHWGSGKSFFMGRIKHNIKAITETARRTENSPFCGTVVPIHFNAWHYVEQNLWASLVHHIFQELDGWIRREQEKEQAQTQPDKLFERLATARRLTFEALEELVTLGLVARKAEEEARAARDQHRKEVGQQRQLTVGDMTAVIRKAFEKELPAETKQALDTLGQSLGMPNLHERTAEVMELWRSGHRTQARADLLLRALWKSTRTRDLAVLAGLLVTVPAGLALGQSWLAEVASWSWLQGANLALGQTLAAGTVLLGMAKRWIDKARPVLDMLDTVRTDLDGLASNAEATHLKLVAEAEAAAEQSRLALQDSERRLNRAQETLAAAEHAFAAQSTAGRLTRFIRERAGGGDYSRHLTLVATIRKDFQSLSDLMRMNEKGGDRLWQERLHRDSALFAHKLEDLLKQHQNRLPASVIDAITQAKPSNMAEDRDYPVFDRIVLYIDDLDRCPPEKVVEVLQAVHLLLAFDLFVVVVAVDVRWVEQSLERTYAGMLKGKKATEGGEMASPRDYLEKIFQIPFWVEPMDGQACTRFLTGLMERIANDDGALPYPTDKPTGPQSAPTTLPAPVAPSAEALRQEPHAIETEQETPEHSGGEDAEVTPSSDGEADRKVPDPQPDPLPAPVPYAPEPSPALLVPRGSVLSPLSSIDRAEIAAVAPLLGGVPRRIKRLLNVYQLLKTQLSTMEVEGRSVDEQTVAVGLAVWLGFTSVEREQARREPDMGNLAAALAEHGSRFHALLQERAKLAGFDLDTAAVRQTFALIVELAQRFSFNGPGNGQSEPIQPVGLRSPSEST